MTSPEDAVKVENQFGDPEKICDQCDHPSGPHVLTPTNEGNPLLGGIMLCPEPECQCLSTWSTPYCKKENVVMPDERWINALRRVLQS